MLLANVTGYTEQDSKVVHVLPRSGLPHNTLRSCSNNNISTMFDTLKHKINFSRESKDQQNSLRLNCKTKAPNMNINKSLSLQMVVGHCFISSSLSSYLSSCRMAWPVHAAEDGLPVAHGILALQSYLGDRYSPGGKIWREGREGREEAREGEGGRQGRQAREKEGGKQGKKEGRRREAREGGRQGKEGSGEGKREGWKRIQLLTIMSMRSNMSESLPSHCRIQCSPITITEDAFSSTLITKCINSNANHCRVEGVSLWREMTQAGRG